MIRHFFDSLRPGCHNDDVIINVLPLSMCSRKDTAVMVLMGRIGAARTLRHNHSDRLRLVLHRPSWACSGPYSRYVRCGNQQQARRIGCTI